MKQTKHSRKSEAQNLCSKCPPHRTHAFKRLRHCAIADGFGDSVQSWWQVGATQVHFLEPGVKVNSDYYRNTVLLNMLLPEIRSVFGDYYLFQQDGAPAHRARDTVTMLQRETPEFICPEMWPPNSPDSNPVDYSIWDMLQERVYCSRIHDVKELKEHLLREWRLLDHAHRHRGSDCAGHFEHKFWASDFLLCFVCFTDTGFRKCDRYKHVQSANIGVKCVTFVSETFTRYGSNITNAWQ